MSHPDTHKMTKPELQEHAKTGCERCQEALRLHDVVDKLIESQDRTIAELESLGRAVTRLERMTKGVVK